MTAAIRHRHLPRIIPALGLLSLLVATPAPAFYCGNELVYERLLKIEVLQRCGPPSFVDRRVEYRTLSIGAPGYPAPGLGAAITTPVEIEEWTYNFGPNRFMQWLLFENGRLILIKDLSYGR
ncbi:DUF2845 domain-containing protein [Methylomagnum sp.]